MTSAALVLERRDGVLIAHIDDGKANALSTELISSLLDAVAEAENDAAISALILHGRPGRFCAGFDLNVMRGGDLAAMANLVSDGGALIHRLYGGSIPVVAACTGHALAAGALILLGCDVRVGADVECKIGLNEVAIGMVLPAWAMTIAVERLSHRHLQRAVVNARVTDARGAVEAGFLDEAVADDQVLEIAIARGRELAGLDRRAYTGTVRALRGRTLETMQQQIAADRALGSVPTV